jgi:hypothetical protein
MKSALIAAAVSAIVASGSTVAATRFINGALIQNHSIPAMKLTPAAIASLRGTQGPRGETGATGPAGSGVSFTLARGPNVDVPPSSTDAGESRALCPAGSYPVGGGFVVTNGFDAYPVVVADTFDTADGKAADGWDVDLGNLTALGATGVLTFHAWATCETGGGPITLPG